MNSYYTNIIKEKLKSASFKRHWRKYLILICLSLSVYFAAEILVELKKAGRFIQANFQTQEKADTNIVAIPELIETENPQGNVQICEKKEIINEIIDYPDVGDDIQKIIGYQNNKVGIYIYAEVRDYVDMADEIINSNGGAWGYALIPYNVKDYDLDKWSHLFELMGRKQIIPIIQLWDVDVEHKDKRDEQIKDSAKFLNSLKWPIKNRYVSAYNEPNDAKFWYGKVNPEEYAEILDETIKALKNENEDFFVMNGALNVSARNSKTYMDARTFMAKMNKEVPGIFEKIDGWASHPYPQPNFSGAVNAYGRDSIRAYQWELDILKKDFNVDTSKLPVFITETGWAHRESQQLEETNRSQFRLNQYQVADNFREAYEKVWLPDEQVVAVTPFTIRYQAPFDHFSWITENGNPYPQYNAIKDMEKVQGKPPTVRFEITNTDLCELIDEKSENP